jgi:perosamine synthetase
MIRLTIPSVDEDDLQAVREVLQSGYLVQGQHVAAFEQSVTQYTGAKYAVAVSNCTAALHLALLALDVQPRDLVLVTAYSYPATANVIVLCGAEPVFVDIQPDTFNMDPGRLEQTLERLMAVQETARRVKAILPVHTFGQMADMPAILEIADHYQIPVIEDAACALGASLDGKQAGNWGVMGCFSFHPRKAITTGEGGMIVTNDSDLAHHLRALRNHGQDPDAPVPDFIMPGFNYRMTEFQAALGTTQMAKLERIICARQHCASIYDSLLIETCLHAPCKISDEGHVYQSYVALLPEDNAAHRREIISQLRKLGIETTIGTWHIPMLTFYRTRYGYAEGDFPVTDDIFSRSITLSLYEALTKRDQEKVVHRLISELAIGPSK